MPHFLTGIVKEKWLKNSINLKQRSKVLASTSVKDFLPLFRMAPIFFRSDRFLADFLADQNRPKSARKMFFPLRPPKNESTQKVYIQLRCNKISASYSNVKSAKMAKKNLPIFFQKSSISPTCRWDRSKILSFEHVSDKNTPEIGQEKKSIFRPHCL